jgi:hypothetical protein
MSTELERRLARLAPEVDVDAARDAMRERQARSRRHHSLLAGSSVLVVAAAVVVLIAAPWHGGERAPLHVVVAPTTAGAPVLRTTTARGSGVEVRVTAPERATAGTRVWFDVVVRNTSTADVWWQAGGCAIPVAGEAGPPSALALPIGGGPGLGEPREWDGDVRSLGTWLADHAAVGAAGIQRDDATGRRTLACTDDSRMQPVHPGEHLEYRGSFEARVAPGPLVDDGDWNLNVSFTGYATPGDYIDHPLDPVTARAPVHIVDDPGRTDAGAAKYAMNFDPRLQPWLDSTVVQDRPDLKQTYVTELSWWRGAWELWLAPHWNGNRLLRMRYDPAQRKVVDVRTVYLGKAPDDEADAARDPGFEPDVVIPLPGS